MPSLHSFNSCWGNRRYFHDVYCEQSHYDWLNQQPSSSSSNLISSNGYYGYQPACTTTQHVMEVDSRPIVENQTRKRSYSFTYNHQDSKRFKNGSGNE